jgi:hypothetical protein
MSRIDLFANDCDESPLSFFHMAALVEIERYFYLDWIRQQTTQDFIIQYD